MASKYCGTVLSKQGTSDEKNNKSPNFLGAISLNLNFIRQMAENATLT